METSVSLVFAKLLLHLGSSSRWRFAKEQMIIGHRYEGMFNTSFAYWDEKTTQTFYLHFLEMPEIRFLVPPGSFGVRGDRRTEALAIEPLSAAPLLVCDAVCQARGGTRSNPTPSLWAFLFPGRLSSPRDRDVPSTACAAPRWIYLFADLALPLHTRCIIIIIMWSNPV